MDPLDYSIPYELLRSSHGNSLSDQVSSRILMRQVEPLPLLLLGSNTWTETKNQHNVGTSLMVRDGCPSSKWDFKPLSSINRISYIALRFLWFHSNTQFHTNLCSRAMVVHYLIKFPRGFQEASRSSSTSSIRVQHMD